MSKKLEHEPLVHSIDTPLGARVLVGKFPNHLGEGVLLQLMMQDPDDGRWSEIYLDSDTICQLINALEEHHRCPSDERALSHTFRSE